MTRDELYQKMKLAIDNEYEAYRLYKDIADSSKDSELKVIFERIAREELQHREILLKRYAILKELAG